MISKNPKIQIVDNAEALSTAAAETIVEHLRSALQTRDAYSIALSGGSTPRGLYALLADDSEWRRQIPWNRVHFFWGDERHVPPDHPDSNYRMAFETLLSKVPVPPQNIHRMRAEDPDAEKAAEDYVREIRRFFNIASGEIPRFDCVLMGIGSDGHTASLFPGTSALNEHKRLVTATWVEKLRSFRITLTLPVFNNADLILFVVSGSHKADILKAVLESDRKREPYPAQRIQPKHGSMLWLVDRQASKSLDIKA